MTNSIYQLEQELRAKPFKRDEINWEGFDPITGRLIHDSNKPLCVQFNVVTMTIASRLWGKYGWEVSEDAPETLEELTQWLDKGNPMTVYKGASDNTIFGCKEHNYAFRAWHDYHHYHSQLPFTPEGEREVRKLQEEDIRKVYGTLDPLFKDLLEIEIDSQVEYYTKHNKFINNQREFTLQQLYKRGYRLKP